MTDRHYAKDMEQATKTYSFQDMPKLANDFWAVTSIKVLEGMGIEVVGIPIDKDNPDERFSYSYDVRIVEGGWGWMDGSFQPDFLADCLRDYIDRLTELEEERGHTIP